jgi:thiol-disulfide isomerase/thioredoxin
MKSVVVAVVASVAALSLHGQQSLRPLDEKVYRELLSAQKGNVILVDFWATWCAPCREEMPQVLALERKFKGSGLRLVTVSCDEPEDQGKAEAFLAEHRTMPSSFLKRVADDEKFIDFVYNKWSGALPALFLYDREGRLTRAFIGETDMTALEKAIRDLL